MNQNHVRKITAPIASSIIAVVLWFFIVSVFPKSGSMSFLGLMPTIVSGLFGGLVASIIAPYKKLTVATLTGILLGGALLSVIIFSGKFPLLNRNPIFWYWPFWLMPTYFIGGLIGSQVTKSV